MMSMIGSSLLWVGWFGFNAGSNLEATGVTALAFVNTMVATAAATLGWMLRNGRSRASPRCLAWSRARSRASSGDAGIRLCRANGSIVLGLVAGSVCFFFCAYVKRLFATMTPSMCSACIASAASSGDRDWHLVAPYLAARPHRLHDQTWLCLARELRHDDAGGDPAKNVLFTLCWSGFGSAILYKFVDLTIGLRATKQPSSKASTYDHGERALIFDNRHACPALDRSADKPAPKTDENARKTRATRPMIWGPLQFARRRRAFGALYRYREHRHWRLGPRSGHGRAALAPFVAGL